MPLLRRLCFKPINLREPLGVFQYDFGQLCLGYLDRFCSRTLCRWRCTARDTVNIPQAGVPIYVNSIGIATANFFMTVFLVVLMIAAVLLAVLSISYCVLAAISQYGQWKEGCIADQYPSFAHAWVLRIVSMARLPFNHIRLLFALVPDRIHTGDNICALSVDAQGFVAVYLFFSNFILCDG